MTQSCIRCRRLWGRRYDPKLYQMQKTLGEKIWPKAVSDAEVFGGLFSYDKTEILLKVALNTITHNLTFLRTCKDGTKALCITHVRNKRRKRQQILNIIPLRD
jgi:hypothetical protein